MSSMNARSAQAHAHREAQQAGAIGVSLETSLLENCCHMHAHSNMYMYVQLQMLSISAAGHGHDTACL